MKTLFRTIFIASIVLMAASCGNRQSKETETPIVEELPAVTVVVAESRLVPHKAIYTSTVLPFAKNNIAPQGVNRIAKVNVEVGDFVRKGQILAEMDKAQLLQAELQYKNRELEYSRVKELHEVGGISQSDLDAIELAYKVAKTTYQNLLDNSVLRSPLDGVVSARNYDAGDMYSMAAPLFTVEQVRPVKLLVGVSEVDYAKVKKGNSVIIKAEALPELTFYGKINRLYPTVDPRTHTVTVEVVVENNYRTLRPGMFTRVELTFGKNERVVIPDIAVVKQVGSGERFVYLLNEDNTVSYQKVILGTRMGAEYEVIEGIPVGAKLVTEGQIRLKDGVKVQVK